MNVPVVSTRSSRRANSCRGGRNEEARYAGLREKSGNGFLVEIGAEGQTGTTTF